MDLRAIVVERCGGIRDAETHLLETSGIVPQKVGLHGADCGFRRFAPAAHFAQTDEAVIGFHFNDGSNEASPMHTVGVAKRSFERNGDCGSANVGDFHNWYRPKNIPEPTLEGFAEDDTAIGLAGMLHGVDEPVSAARVEEHQMFG